MAAVLYIPKIQSQNYKFFNIGTGKGTSVMELLNAFRKVNSLIIPYNIVDRRDGDIPIVYCDNTQAINELGWKHEKTINDICKDAWRFQLASCYDFIKH
jgi:UDP-glucose 4-epimerase